MGSYAFRKKGKSRKRSRVAQVPCKRPRSVVQLCTGPLGTRCVTEKVWALETAAFTNTLVPTLHLCVAETGEQGSLYFRLTLITCRQRLYLSAVLSGPNEWI